MKAVGFILIIFFLDIIAAIIAVCFWQWYFRNNVRIGRAVLRLWDSARVWFYWAVRR
jgi:hypothetical protein